MDKIQELIINKSWVMQCFDDLHGRGVWSIIVPHINAAYQLYELLDGGDTQSILAFDYLLDSGAWLPTALGKNMVECVEILELKVANFEEDPTWIDDVNKACQLIMCGKFLEAYNAQEPTLFRTGIVQPKDAIYFLREGLEGLYRITIDKKSLKIVSEELFNDIPYGWTKKDVKDLLDEGRRFFGESLVRSLKWN